MMNLVSIPSIPRRPNFLGLNGGLHSQQKEEAEEELNEKAKKAPQNGPDDAENPSRFRHRFPGRGRFPSRDRVFFLLSQDPGGNAGEQAEEERQDS
jgi:hypothetical protein